MDTAEFEIFGIDEIGNAPLTVHADVRYNLVARRNDDKREERVGSWRMVWSRDASQSWKMLQWEAGEETLSVVRGPAFIDVTAQAIGQTELLKTISAWSRLLAHGTGWRSWRGRLRK